MLTHLTSHSHSVFVCMCMCTGETGLLVAKITKVAPFSGYANNKQQTDKKKLRDVFEQGDIYFNSGDLMKVDKEGFVYFQDRIGDTFRCMSIKKYQACLG